MKVFFNCFVIVILNLLTFSRGWHLARVGLNESYQVLHLSTHFSRVFLSINVKSQSFPTLIESMWPEKYLPMFSIIYPSSSLHANGDRTDCTLLQQATWSQVDSLSRLWVMDVGWRDKENECPAKLLVFDLIRDNIEVLRINCNKYIATGGAEVLAIKLGPLTSTCGVERYIYFILANDPNILSYDILEQTWHRHKLLSRKYDSIEETLPIQPIDLAFGSDNEMLISDADGALYSSSNALLLGNANAIARNSSFNRGSVHLELLGSFLGPSKSMLMDLGQGALFYAVPKYGAIVRCEPKSNLTAEGNEIIYMTSRNVQQLFFGTHGSVWLLSDRWLKPTDHCFPA